MRVSKTKQTNKTDCHSDVRLPKIQSTDRKYLVCAPLKIVSKRSVSNNINLFRLKNIPWLGPDFVFSFGVIMDEY